MKVQSKIHIINLGLITSLFCILIAFDCILILSSYETFLKTNDFSKFNFPLVTSLFITFLIAYLIYKIKQDFRLVVIDDESITIGRIKVNVASITSFKEFDYFTNNFFFFKYRIKTFSIYTSEGIQYQIPISSFKNEQSLRKKIAEILKIEYQDSDKFSLRKTVYNTGLISNFFFYLLLFLAFFPHCFYLIDGKVTFPFFFICVIWSTPWLLILIKGSKYVITEENNLHIINSITRKQKIIPINTIRNIDIIQTPRQAPILKIIQNDYSVNNIGAMLLSYNHMSELKKVPNNA